MRNNRPASSRRTPPSDDQIRHAIKDLGLDVAIKQIVEMHNKIGRLKAHIEVLGHQKSVLKKQVAGLERALLKQRLINSI